MMFWNLILCLWLLRIWFIFCASAGSEVFLTCPFFEKLVFMGEQTRMCLLKIVKKIQNALLHSFVFWNRIKVCLLRFRPEDLRKSFGGRIYVREGKIPSKFDWSGPSPKNRKPPTGWRPLPAMKKHITEDCSQPINTDMEEIYVVKSTSHRWAVRKIGAGWKWSRQPFVTKTLISKRN